MRTGASWIMGGVVAAVLVAGALRGEEEAAAADAKKAQAAQLKTAARQLNAALRALDDEKVAEAAIEVARAGGKSAMRLIVSKLGAIPESKDGLYWALVRGATSFADREGLDELAAFIEKNSSEGVARDLLYGLLRNHSPNVVHALEDLLLSGPDDLRLLAVSIVGATRSRNAVDLLIRLLESEEKSDPKEPTRFMFLAGSSLTRLTHQEFGPASVNWRGWWEKNRDKPLPTGAYAAAGEEGSSTGTAVDFAKLDPVRRDEVFGLEKAPPRKIIVLSADYTKPRKWDYNNDHMERVLEQMKIPHTVVRREDFLEYDLAETGVILINCAQFHEHCICPDCKPGGERNNRLVQCTGCDTHVKFKAELSADAIKKLQMFVLQGGYLFCEDWTVKEVVERGFPKYVVAGEKLKEGEADVVPARGRGTHPYLKGIFVRELGFGGASKDTPYLFDEGFIFDDEEDDAEENEKKDDSRTTVVVPPEEPEETFEVDPVDIEHQWKVDDESFSFDLVGGRKVVPLLASAKIHEQSDGHGTVAVAFRPGSLATSLPPGELVPGARAPGVVLVVLSHFGKQSSSESEHSIQNILLNFLLDAYRNQSAPARRKK